MNTLNEEECNQLDKMGVKNQLDHLLKLQKTYAYIVDTVTSKVCKELYQRKMKKNDQKIQHLMKNILSPC